MIIDICIYISGIIFVVDSADRERIQEAKEELLRILDTQEMRGVPLVVVNNKQDLPGNSIIPYVYSYSWNSYVMKHI